jgi:response regulator of citrate/malate metabolism
MSKRNVMGVHMQTAMIIDDDGDLNELLAQMLEERRIYTLAVQTLSEAEAYLGFLKPTLIFLDNSFPDGLGINFIKQIRSADEEIRIIMMTADRDKWIQEKAIDEGASYFLHKPFNRQSIYQALDKVNASLNTPKYH